MAELFANNAQSTLSAPIGTTDTSITLASGDGAKFPSPTGGDFFRLTLFSKTTGTVEITFCTARSGDVCTITREQESTTAASFDAGDVAANRPTAGFFESLTVTSSSIQANDFNYGADSGSVANTYVVTLNPVPAAYGGGLSVLLDTTRANTGAATLESSGTTGGAQPIQRPDGNALQAGDIPANSVVELVYSANAAAFVLVGAVSSRQLIVALSASTTIDSTYAGKLIECSGTVTLTLDGAATLGAGFSVDIKNVGTGTVTVSRATSTDTIDGTAADISLWPESSAVGGISSARYAVNSATDGFLAVWCYAPQKQRATGTLAIGAVSTATNAQYTIDHGLPSDSVDFGFVFDTDALSANFSYVTMFNYAQDWISWYVPGFTGSVRVTGATLAAGQLGARVDFSSSSGGFNLRWWAQVR